MIPDSTPCSASRTHRPTRRTRRRPLVELARRGAQRLPPPRLRRLARDRAQPGADAAADRARQARRRGGRSGVPRRLRSRHRRARRRARRAQHLVDEHHAARRAARPIAYFSAEFALHQSLPIYAGGLGVLAGDHCKEASDLGVPLIGVGFMYPQGYFHQHISAEGWQEESYERLNWADAPIEPALTPDGKPCITAVPLGDRSVLVAVWRVRLGRVTLYLLDTNLEENAPWDRELLGAPLRRRSRNAHPAGDHPRHRRRPRAEGARRRIRACSI